MNSLLTPPLSPRYARSSSDLFSLDDNLTPMSARSSLAVDTPIGHDSDNLDSDMAIANLPDAIIVCPFEVDMIQNDRGRDQMFGSGAWSNVYKATPVKMKSTTTATSLLTPPASPTAPMPIVVAVKRPARIDAKPILENEARILSYLKRLTSKRVPVVSFHGIIEDTTSLVLDAVPLSLEDYLRRCAISAKQTLTTATMSNPVVGSTKLWLSLAHSLISALTWLHDFAGVVHGDIKPGNFLLEPLDTISDTDFPYRPLFIDFSSSHRIDTTHDEVPCGTLSAVTREYTAPELLKSSVLRDPKSTATTASDVFSLAVTLLVAATGNLMVYDGSVFQRQAMATQGWQVLGFAQCGANGARVPGQGVVERALDKAVLRHDMGRITVTHWLYLVEEMQKGEPTK
jgi:hypothetical protein